MTFRSAYLLAMVALVMLMASGPAFAQTTTDYDMDDDGLIDVSTLAQLNAIRWDLNGDGAVDASATTTDTAAYNNAFSGRVTTSSGRMGCPSGTCTGYELLNDLNFDTDGDNDVDANDSPSYPNWDPIGGSYAAVFDGKGHTISNLTITSNTGYTGLFDTLGSSGVIRDVGMIDASVSSTGSYVGILVGSNNGTITSVSVQGGSVSSTGNSGFGGGLAGGNFGTIRASYSTASVDAGTTSGAHVGGLMGAGSGISTTINSYAAGTVSGTGSNARVGGFIGRAVGTPTITGSYCDTTVHTQCVGYGSASVVGYTTAELQSPTGYTGIFANWNVDLDGDRLPDNPWNFGTSSQYPTLNTPTQRAQVIDYDQDDDGLIDIQSLDQLNVIRYDLDGNGIPTDTLAYAAAFPAGQLTGATSTRMGCTANCTGYELLNDLDFDTAGNDDVADAPYANWSPIGTFSATFNGRGHTISNLTISQTGNSHVGLFAQLGSGGSITSVGLLDPSVSNGGANAGTGSLVGFSSGPISASYATGGNVNSSAANAFTGGLVGRNSSTITASYATVSVNTGGSGQYSAGGGLVGNNWQSGVIRYSYAAGTVTGASYGPNGGRFHCLTGWNNVGLNGTATESYFDRNVCTLAGRTIGGGTRVGAGTGKTTAELQSPTGYSGIYAAWNRDLNSDRLPDNPWNFGTSSQYPTLNTPGQREIDYDMDNDGLIDVSSLLQLNAIRHDLNGDGVPTDTTAYAGAFPGGKLDGTASTLMGCTSGCSGYELLNDLDFDTNGDNSVTAADAYPNWSPIGTFSTTFNGRGHTISNLTISSNNTNAGLFANLALGGTIEDVGIINASVSAVGANHSIAVLLGINNGTVTTSYVQGGSVTLTSGNGHLGGLAGFNNGVIRAAYATASVDGGSLSNSRIGGLIGSNNTGRVTATYAAGAVSGTGTGTVIGGFVGRVSSASSMMSYTYCDSTVHSAALSCVGDRTSGATVSNTTVAGKTTADLQTPIGYTGIYANWNIDLDSDSSPDFPWKFGTSSQYPTLNTPAQRAIARQVRVSISSGSVPEGAAGATATLRFTVQLHRAHPSQVTVAYADAGTGTAESGTDYTALAGGTLTFAAGETSKTIDVLVIGDAAVEPNETVIVMLSSPSPADAVLAVVSATGTITNDDQPPTDTDTDTDTEPEPEPEPNREPTFSEAVDPRSYPQGNEIPPLTLPEATDGDGDLTYALTPDLPDGLTFNAETLTVSGTPTEASEKAIYTLTATDEDGDAAEVSFFLTIIGNLLPSFGDASVDAQVYTRKQEIDALTLPQATGGDDPLTYALTPDLPEGLRFDAEARIVSGTPLDAIAETTYTLTATDSDGDPATLMFTLSVMTDPIPIFGDTTIAAQGYQHQAFAPLTLPQATGGDAPLTYALNPDPPLPEGLKFDGETLTVSGTPLKAMDEMTYTLTATDGNGDEAHLMFTLEVPDLMPTFGDTTIAAQSYLVNQEIESLTFPEASSGDGMLVYILLPSLPDGISFNPDTRTLSGMPTEEKDMATYTLSALDTDGDVASLPFTLEVSLPSPDFNGDGNVNFADFLIFAEKFGSRLGQERYDARCDLNGDSQINFDDFLDFAAAFGG